MLGAVGRATPGTPIRYLVNTHLHGDHTHGNSLLPRTTEVIAHEATREGILTDTVIDGCPPIWQPLPDWGAVTRRAPDLTIRTALTLHSDSHPIELHHPGHPAHTNGDLITWLPEQRVLFAADLLFHRVTPLVFMGSLDGALRSLDWSPPSHPSTWCRATAPSSTHTPCRRCSTSTARTTDSYTPQPRPACATASHPCKRRAPATSAHSPTCLTRNASSSTCTAPTPTPPATPSTCPRHSPTRSPTTQAPAHPGLTGVGLPHETRIAPPPPAKGCTEQSPRHRRRGGRRHPRRCLTGRRPGLPLPFDRGRRGSASIVEAELPCIGMAIRCGRDRNPPPSWSDRPTARCPRPSAGGVGTQLGRKDRNRPTKTEARRHGAPRLNSKKATNRR
ncbi:MBL fold metallo-hydrolase [Streptomyces sp. JV178]|uniref:MBL fold metallo-hydrolase n=1 Tax=Streptomyces sp. JV178 TaxID=858632 RepID=UPI0034D49E8C